MFQKCGTDPQKVEQVLKAGHSSTNCETVPQSCGAAPPKSGTGTIDSDESHNSMLFQDIKQCTTFNCVSYRSTSSHKLLFRIIVKYYVLCLYV